LHNDPLGRMMGQIGLAVDEARRRGDQAVTWSTMRSQGEAYGTMYSRVGPEEEAYKRFKQPGNEAAFYEPSGDRFVSAEGGPVDETSIPEESRQQMRSNPVDAQEWRRAATYRRDEDKIDRVMVPRLERRPRVTFNENIQYLDADEDYPSLAEAQANIEENYAEANPSADPGDVTPYTSALYNSDYSAGDYMYDKQTGKEYPSKDRYDLGKEIYLNENPGEIMSIEDAISAYPRFARDFNKTVVYKPRSEDKGSFGRM
ncbi:unnamed protein product, partial [marine sediment metagenome]